MDSQKKTEKRKSGFTLTEVLIASTITMLVTTTLISTLIAAHKVVRDTMEKSEMALRSRQLREKLLFRLTEDGGLLSANKIDIDSSDDEVEVSIPDSADINSSNDTEIKISRGRFKVETDKDLFLGNHDWLNSTLGTFTLDSTGATNAFEIVQARQLWITLKMKTALKDKTLDLNDPRRFHWQTFRIPNLTRD